MKPFTVVIPVLLMVVLNWKTATRHAATDGLSSGWSTVGGTTLSFLVGLALSAFLIRSVYRAVRYRLDRGIPTYPRFRIPWSARLIPHPKLYFILLAFFFGFRHSRSAVDASGDTFSTEMVAGPSCSMAPFWLAVLSITLWNVVCALAPDEKAAQPEASKVHA